MCPVPSRSAPARCSCTSAEIHVPRFAGTSRLRPHLEIRLLEQHSTAGAATRIDAASTRSHPSRPRSSPHAQHSHLALGSGTRICGSRNRHSHLWHSDQALASMALASMAHASGTRISGTRFWLSLQALASGSRINHSHQSLASGTRIRHSQLAHAPGVSHIRSSLLSHDQRLCLCMVS